MTFLYALSRYCVDSDVSSVSVDIKQPPCGQSSLSKQMEASLVPHSVGLDDSRHLIPRRRDSSPFLTGGGVSQNGKMGRGQRL